MPSDDILLNKAAIVERCIRRIREEYALNPSLDKATHVDALTLNVERACQATIVAAMHVVALRRLGIPQGSADAFGMLRREGLLSLPVSRRMEAMTGFRNVAIHQYRMPDHAILSRVATEGWRDFVGFFGELGISILPDPL